MLPAVATGALRVGSLLSFKGVEIFGSANSVSKKAAETIKGNQSATKAITKTVSDISQVETKIQKSKESQRDILQRQEKFLSRTTTGTTGATKMVGGMINKVLKKPVEVLQKLLLGMLVIYVPKIISGVNKLINQFKLIRYQLMAVFDLAKNFIGNTLNIIQAVIKNNASFDFADKNGRLKAAYNEFEQDLKSDFSEIESLNSAWSQGEKELAQTINMLDQGRDPSSAVQPQETITGQPASGSATVNGTAEEYRIAAAVATEAGRGVSATDVLQVAANRVADSRYPDNFTDVFAQPGQFEGVFGRGIGDFRNIKTADDAAAFSGRTVDQINGYVGDLRNSDFRANSADQIGGALEFRAAPQYYQNNMSARPSGTGSDGRIPGSSWRGGAGDNQILTDRSQDPMRSGGAAPIGYSQGRSTASNSGTTGIASPSAGDSPGMPASSSNSVNIAKAAEGLRGLDTSRYGENGCVYAVNQVYKAAGIATPWGSSVSVPNARAVLIKQGYVQVGVKNALPGDIVIMSDTGSPPWVHIGVVSTQGTVIHNSSRNMRFTNEETFDSLQARYVNIEVFRAPSAVLKSKLNLDGLSGSENRAAVLQSLNYDREGADMKENISTKLIMLTQPVVARQQTIVNQPQTQKSVSLPSGGGGSSSLSKYNDALLSRMS